MSSLPLFRRQVFLIGSGLKDTSFVGTDVAITLQLRIGDGTDTGLEVGRTGKVAVVEEPYSALTVGQRHHQQRQLGLVTPPRIAQTVETHAVDISRLAIVGGVERNPIDTEADVTMIILFKDGKNRTVGGLYAPVRPPAIECTGIAVRAVDTDETVALREILLLTGYSGSDAAKQRCQ